MKTSTRKVQQCTCGRFVKTRKSTFTKFDVQCGLILVGIAVIALLIKAPAALLLVVLPLLFLPWVMLLVNWYAKGHSLKCAIRWAAIVVVGSIGGFGL